MKHWLVLAGILFIGTDQAATLDCKVIHVADGDTVTCLLANKQKERIRLADIDAPESKQAFGNQSKQLLAKMVHGQQIAVKTSGKDQYGRLIGTLYLNGQDVNYVMVRSGMAWVYKEYSKNPKYYLAQRNAQKAKLGLWRDPKPIYPSEFRRQAKRMKQH